ncbi:MAG: hypothetical protein IK141_02355 [Clostridia bacterium]|nr:hypothetical protein [Clostridia bacterium]
MKPFLKFLTLILALILVLALAGCGGKSAGITIAVPNDTTNEARALRLLEAQGFLKLKDGAGITATILDIVENPKNIRFEEVEAAQLPNVRKDVDFAVINSNYALEGKLNPARDALAVEGSYSAYGNILAVKAGRETDPVIRALLAALQSKQTADYITASYDGAVISVVDALTDGYDPLVDYAALSGQTVSVAATPTPHAEILNGVVKEILAARGITLQVLEFTDYVQPNNVVDSGEVDANYFQHVPYLDDFNAENGTQVVSVGAIHVEPMGLYGGKQSSLDPLK